MHADTRKLLWDAKHAADRVARFTAAKSFDDYQSDELLRSAVERQLGIVGEALAQLRRIDPDTASAVAALPHIIGFRNVLIHGYAAVDNRIVWGVIEADLAALHATLHRLLAGQSLP
jgi:uncharacterized protein with HEPN domain